MLRINTFESKMPELQLYVGYMLGKVPSLNFWGAFFISGQPEKENHINQFEIVMM